MGEKIREYRERKGMTQRDLAASIGVDASAVSLWESGKTAPTANNIVKLASILGVTPGDLFPQ